MKVAVIGCGYVGLGTGLALALTGHEVAFVDLDEAKVSRLARGRAPFYEPGLEEALHAVTDRARFTTDYRRALDGAEVGLIAVGTPPRPDGTADFSFVRKAAEGLAGNAAGGELLVAVKSTVPPGTTRAVAGWLERRRPDVTWRVAANPEFLRQGHVLEDSLYPLRLVFGADQAETAERLERLYGELISGDFPAPPFVARPDRSEAPRGPALPEAVPVFRTSPETAELAKYATNAFLAARVSLINEIANLCDRVGADVVAVAGVVGSDPRIGPRFLEAGLGYGGSCLPKDVLTLCRLAERAGYAPRLLPAVHRVNAAQPGRIIARLERLLGGLGDTRIAVLGLSFKPGTADLRGAPSLALVSGLVAKGAEVRVHDPVALAGARGILPAGVVRCRLPGQAFTAADAVILATEWPEYQNLDWPGLRRRMRRPVLIDCRNALDPVRMTGAGFVYAGVGRGDGGRRLAGAGHLDAAPNNLFDGPGQGAKPGK